MIPLEMNQSETQQHPFEKKRIPFVDLVRIFLGRKRYFILGLAICLLASIAITYTKEPQHRYTSLFQIGSLERNMPIQEPQEAVTLIEESLYPAAAQDMDNAFGVGMTAGHERQSNLIRVLSVGAFGDAERIRRLHEAVLKELLEVHNNLQREYTDKLDNALSAAKEELELIKQDGRQVNVAKAQIHRERMELQKQMAKIQESELVSLASRQRLTSEWRWLINIFIGVIAGIFLGLFLVYASELWAYTKKQLRDFG